jgi:hypothetical protein
MDAVAIPAHPRAPAPFVDIHIPDEFPVFTTGDARKAITPLLRLRVVRLQLRLLQVHTIRLRLRKMRCRCASANFGSGARWPKTAMKNVVERRRLPQRVRDRRRLPRNVVTVIDAARDHPRESGQSCARLLPWPPAANRIGGTNSHHPEEPGSASV